MVNKTTQSALSVMALFVVVGALWGGIGYVYSDHSLAKAALWGGIVIAVGWCAVVISWVVKYRRLRSRRRNSNGIDDVQD
ncbi:hypothetical protein A3K89_05565 [Rhodococcoides kyotonense]|uniref:Uncharacterized protein n=1 Tax=Rhodococcoides kyotonense TaxID=398843 RepID=A0A177YI64_9NOCA|nr:hypothetical protein A3K89_05565 [Rhodococcus kyotonensis]